MRNKHTGNDYGGEYTYYDIIDFETCYGCEHCSDNCYEERFECLSEMCNKEDN